MLIRRTHLLMQALLAIFIVYLLLTRAILSWAQYAPEHFSSFLQKQLHIELQFDALDISQHWLGFEARISNLHLHSENMDVQAENLHFDLNLFSFSCQQFPMAIFCRPIKSVLSKSWQFHKVSVRIGS